jgi:hypothetical protein
VALLNNVLFHESTPFVLRIALLGVLNVLSIDQPRASLCHIRERGKPSLRDHCACVSTQPSNSYRTFARVLEACSSIDAHLQLSGE